MSKNQKLLIVIAPAIALSQIALFQFLVYFLGDTWGYLLGYVIYWLAWCIPVTVLFLQKNRTALWSFPKRVSKKPAHWIALSLVACPAIATGVAVFPQYAPAAGWITITLALFFAGINAPLEELLWRSVFPSAFPNSLFFGYFYPAICFGAWHLAPALAKDSGMEGGMLSFVGGALFMGFLWGWYAYRYKTVLLTTVSHFLTNFFAFTGFLYVNWFV